MTEIPGRPALGRPAGLTLSRLEPIFRVEAKQPTYLHEVHALASAPPWKSYKRTPTPPFQDTKNWSKSKASIAAHISLENRERGEVRVRRGAGVSAPLQLYASEE